MKNVICVFCVLTLLLTSCDRYGTPKSEEEISENAIECVNSFIECIENGNNEKAAKYCLPYFLGEERFDLPRLLKYNDQTLQKSAISISPNVDIKSEEKLTGDKEFKYATVNAKIDGEDVKFYVVFDRGDGEKYYSEKKNSKGQPILKNTVGRAVIVDTDGLFPLPKGDDDTFPVVNSNSPQDVLSFAVMGLLYKFDDQSSSAVRAVQNHNSNSDDLNFIRKFENCINYSIANDATPKSLSVDTSWEDLVDKSFSPQLGINLDNLVVKTMYNTGLGFKIKGFTIIDSYNLLDLDKYYAKHYSDILPGFILPSGYYFGSSLSDIQLIDEMAKNEDSARQQMRYLNR